MLTIRRSSAFKRDYRKIKATPHYRNVDPLLEPVLKVLVAGHPPLAERYMDHALGGNWKGYRECHIRADLLLVYQKSKDTLLLVRLGTHSELF